MSNKPNPLAAKIASLSQVMAGETVSELNLILIELDPSQPRKTADPAKLSQLAASIKARGVQQPIVVRRNGPNAYLIVFGERRFRAAKLAGLVTIPAIVRDVSDQDLRAARLVENMHREDVDPIEEAQAIKEFIDFLGGGHGAAKVAADELGISAATVSQRLALLSLPAPVKAAVEAGEITDASTAVTLGKIHGADPEAAAALLDKAKKGGVSRDEVREANRATKPKQAPAPAAGDAPERCKDTPDLLDGKTDAERAGNITDSGALSAPDLSVVCKNDAPIREVLPELRAVLISIESDDAPADLLTAVVREIRGRALAMGLNWETILAAANDNTEKTSNGGDSANGR